MLAIAEGRKNGSGDAGNIDLVLKRSSDGGTTWSPLQLVQDEFSDPSANITIGNPTPVVDALDPQHPGRIWMPFTRNNDRVFVTYSDDHTATWKLGAVDTRTGNCAVHPNENVAVELVDSRIYFNARDQNGSSQGTRAVAYSSNGGLTFAPPFAEEPNLVTPVVQNSALRFKAVDEGDDENVLLYSSPAQWSSRRDFTIRVSFDEGATWGMDTLIHQGPAAYSDLVKIDTETIGVLFEAGASLYNEILFSSFRLDDLAPRP